MADEISLEITETITKVEVTEDVTSINITPNITSVELKGISISNAGSATAMAYAGESNTLGYGSTVAASLDHINTNGLNKNLDQTIDGNITFADGHTITFPTSGYTALELNDNSMNVAGITASADITSATKMEAPLFKGDLEGAVHFKASGSGLAKGDVVYISGYAGQRTTVDKADASDSAKMPAFGIVNATQGNNNVDILTFGSMLHLSTTGIATGTELYVSANTPGGYETSAPTGEGNLVQKIAKVVRGDSNSGSIKIMGAGRTNATPNLDSGNIFLGNASNISTTASFDTTFASSFATRTTTDLTEGDNEYFTSARADARVDLQTGSNLDLSQKTTTELAEGDNEYYTAARFDTAFDGKTTLDLTEDTNLYYTAARFDTAFDGKTTLDLTEDTNLYYTDARVNTKLGSGVDNIVTTGYLRGPSTFTIDPAGHGDNTGKVVIAGDLQVDGTTTTINSTELTIDDKTIVVAANAANATDAHSAGLQIAGANAFLVYSSLEDNMQVNKDFKSTGSLQGASIKDTSGDLGDSGQALFSTGTGTNWAGISTSDVSEGQSNLYYTNTRVRDEITGAALDMGSNNITTTGKVLFSNLYAAEVDLPDASTYHGMFAHVHATGKGYFAHGDSWHKLLDESSSTTDNLSEGSSNIYYTDALVDSKIAAGVSNIVTTGYLRGPAAFTIDPATHGDNTGKVIIAGDLQVDGTTTTINSTTLDVDVKEVTLAKGAQDASQANGAGINIDGVAAKITYNGTNNRWDFNRTIRSTGDIIALGDLTGDDLTIGDITSTGNFSTTGNVSVGGVFKDSTDSAGSNNQVLSSTGTGTSWVNSSGVLEILTDSSTDGDDTMSIDLAAAKLDFAGGTGIDTNHNTASTVSIGLETVSGLSAGQYGAAGTIPQITVDTTGRVTAIDTVTGQTGPRGPEGATTFTYTFDNDTVWASGNPGHRYLKSNQANLTNTTQFNISYKMDDPTSSGTANIDISEFIKTVADGDDAPTSTIKGHFRLAEQSDPSNFVLYEITGGTNRDNVLFLELEVNYLAGTVTSFSDNEPVFASFTRTGDAGDAGSGSGSVRAVGVDTDGDGTTDNTLESSEDLVLKAGTNVTLAEAGGVVTVNSSGGGSVRAVGIDTNGDGTTDNTLESSEDLVLKAGTNVTLAEADGVVTVNSSGGGSVRSVGVDTNGDGTTDNTLESSEDLVLKAGTNVTLAEADGVVTVNSLTPADVLVDTDFTSNGFMKRIGDGVYVTDSNSYLSTSIGGTVNGGLTVGGFLSNQNLAVYGNINVTGTVDGVDIASRNDVLTTTTTTADNALPKAGGQMTGNITFSGTQTVDGRDLSADGARLDTIPYHRARYERLRYTTSTITLTTSYQNISQTPEIYSPSTPVKCSRYIEFQTEIEWKYISSSNNDLRFKLEVTVPTSNVTATTLGTATAGPFSGYSTVSNYEAWFYVSGDVTHHLTVFGRLNKTGVSGATEVIARSWRYDSVNDRTYILVDSNPGFSISTGNTVYWHPYAWESAGTTLFAEETMSERYVGTGSRQNITLKFKTTYDDNQLKYKAYLKEVASTDSAVARSVEVTLTEVGEV